MNTHNQTTPKNNLSNILTLITVLAIAIAILAVTMNTSCVTSEAHADQPTAEQVDPPPSTELDLTIANMGGKSKCSQRTIDSLKYIMPEMQIFECYYAKGIVYGRAILRRNSSTWRFMCSNRRCFKRSEK